MMATARQKAKFRSFVRRLRELLPNLPIDIETVAVGLLERLWHTTATDALRGDIGKLSNDQIAESIGWHGNAIQIIEVLIETKWIDLCEKHRLVIHDWHDHAPSYVKGNASKIGGFVSQSPIGLSPGAQPIGPSHEGGRSYPIHTIPILSNPNQSNSSETNPELIDTIDVLFEEFWGSFPSLRKTDKKETRAEFKNAIDGGADPRIIIEAAKEYSGSQVAKGKYVKGPKSWLSKECWEDDRSAWENADCNDTPAQRRMANTKRAIEEFANGILEATRQDLATKEDFLNEWEKVTGGSVADLTSLQIARLYRCMQTDVWQRKYKRAIARYSSEHSHEDFTWLITCDIDKYVPDEVPDDEAD